jgi:hypothetical protein
LARLTLVELRRAADTRAGFWLIVTIAVLSTVRCDHSLVTDRTPSTGSSTETGSCALATSTFSLRIRRTEIS